MKYGANELANMPRTDTMNYTGMWQVRKDVESAVQHK